MAGATCGTVVAIRTTPDLDASSVSSACGGGGEDTSSNSTDTNRANDDGGEIEDLEEEDSFISCSLHSTREEENDIPWDVWKTPEKDQENSDRNSNPQVVVVVYQPQQQESVPDHPSPIALLPRQLIGQRRKRTALIQSGCLADGISILPSCEESVYAGCYPDDSAFADNKIMCNILVGLWGGPDDDDDDAREPSETEFVTVAVEATAICPMDLQMQSHGGNFTSSKHSNENVPLTPAGSNLVGVVHSCSGQVSERYGIKPGSRVASLIRWGGNARYVKVPPEQLFDVPESLDSSDVATLISSHLPAFQALHHGRSRPVRYSTSCLSGKRVFIVADGAISEVLALIRLAQYAGTSELYVSVPLEHHNVMKKHRVAVLTEDPADWMSVVQGSMDLVLDYGFPKNFSAVRSSLARKGRLVCCPQPLRRESIFDCTHTSELQYLLERYQLSLMKRATLFLFKEYVEQFRTLVFDDTAFLLTILATRKIRPQVDRFITLRDVPSAHDEIRSNLPVSGAIICEPWRE